MIPLRLAFEAFGPFPGRQEIDFTTFEEERIFLITGPTGSGKTTLFDAITFCLYGTASGMVREADSFKSQFAGESAVCWAEFEFLVHGKRYLVHREPIQLRLRRTGNRTKENSTATLTFEDGTILSGAQTVDGKIQEILGINADQFKKIVMLPQGEFRKFLADDANEKQKTLRKIFSTDLLERFGEQLRMKASEAHTNAQAALAKCNAVADTLVTESNPELETELLRSPRNYDPLLGLLAADVQVRERMINFAQDGLEAVNREIAALQIDRVRELNRKHRLLTENRAALTDLHSRDAYFSALQERLTSFRAIHEISAYADTGKRLQAELAGLEQKRTAEQKNMEKLVSSLCTAETEFLSAQQKRGQAPTLLHEAELLKSVLQLAVEMETNRLQIARETMQLEELNRRKTQFEQNLCYAQQRELYQELQEKQHKLMEAKEAIELCGQYYEGFQAVSDDYQAHMNLFLNNQASLLAEGLIPGKPCPVCGSLEHPCPSPKSEDSVTREQLEKKKEQYEAATRRLKEQQGSCGPLLSSVGFSRKEHSRLSEYLPDLILRIQTLEAAMQEHQAEIQRLKQQREGTSFSDETVSAALEHLSEINAGLAAADARLTALRQTAEEYTEKLREKGKGQPDQSLLTQDSAYMKKKIQLLESEAASRETEFENTRKERERLLGEAERAREAIRQMQERVLSSEAGLREAKQQCQALLEQAGLTQEEYELRHRESAAEHSMERELRDWREKIARMQGGIASLEPELEGWIPVDLAALEQRHGELTEQQKQYQEQYNKALLYYRTNKDGLTRLKQHWKLASAQEATWRERESLWEVASGRRSDNISFERYVLAGYFNDVVENANLRLEQMTNSRYTLKRRTEREKGNRSSGLSLEVFDAYTGQNRHINTLSGGESFKIALSLALGLADIVSQNSGGIELNTMFIDEGFGSLDQVSLEAAIECLNRLKSTGRYIGIISHVSELKEKIPARLTVVQEPQGSHVEIRGGV